MTQRIPANLVPYNPNMPGPQYPWDRSTLPPSAPIQTQPATQNPNGLDPYPSQPWASGAHYVKGGQSVAWQVDGANYVAYLATDLMNVRPEWNLGEEVPHNAVPVAGGSTAGLNRYFAIGLFPPPVNNTLGVTANPPATFADLRIWSTEVIGVVSSSRLFSLAEVERTLEIQAGGTVAGSTVALPGGSLLQFCVPSGIRFYKVLLRFQYPTASGTPPTIVADYASN